MRNTKLGLAIAVLFLAGCSSAATQTTAAAPREASDVPAGWTTVDTPDAQALAFKCTITPASAGSQRLNIIAWNISAVQEQAWHLIVVDFDSSGRQIATLDNGDYDIGSNWVQPGQKLTFTSSLMVTTTPATSCRVTGLL